MIRRLTFFALLTLVSGGALAQSAPATGAPSSPTEAPAPTSSIPLPPAVPLSPEAPTRTYICSDGAPAELVEQEAAGVLRISRLGENFALFQTVGSNPPQYVARGGTIVLTGDLVLVFRPHHKPIRCERQPESPIAGTVWGMITRKDAATLPSGTRAKVMLVDTLRRDAPALELASTEITTIGNQPPLHFLIRYNPAWIKADEPGRYAVEARISDPKGKLLYVSEAKAPVFTEGMIPPPMRVEVVPAPADK